MLIILPKITSKKALIDHIVWVFLDKKINFIKLFKIFANFIEIYILKIVLFDRSFVRSFIRPKIVDHLLPDDFCKKYFGDVTRKNFKIAYVRFFLISHREVGL